MTAAATTEAKLAQALDDWRTVTLRLPALQPLATTATDPQRRERDATLMARQCFENAASTICFQLGTNGGCETAEVDRLFSELGMTASKANPEWGRPLNELNEATRLLRLATTKLGGTRPANQEPKQEAKAPVEVDMIKKIEEMATEKQSRYTRLMEVLLVCRDIYGTIEKSAGYEVPNPRASQEARDCVNLLLEEPMLSRFRAFVERKRIVPTQRLRMESILRAWANPSAGVEPPALALPPGVMDNNAWKAVFIASAVTLYLQSAGGAAVFCWVRSTLAMPGVVLAARLWNPCSMLQAPWVDDTFVKLAEREVENVRDQLGELLPTTPAEVEKWGFPRPTAPAAAGGIPPRKTFRSEQPGRTFDRVAPNARQQVPQQPVQSAYLPFAWVPLQEKWCELKGTRLPNVLKSEDDGSGVNFRCEACGNMGHKAACCKTAITIIRNPSMRRLAHLDKVAFVIDGDRYDPI
jgi:hypothetical protein